MLISGVRGGTRGGQLGGGCSKSTVAGNCALTAAVSVYFFSIGSSLLFCTGSRHQPQRFITHIGSHW